VTAIAFEGLTKAYGAKTALDRVNLDISEGALFGFIGPNGAGKTTAIRLLLGMLRPDGGRAAVFGRDCWSEGKAIRRNLGYLPGDLRLPAWLNVHNALRMLGLAHGRDLTDHGLELAEYFELDPAVVVRSMSRGMRQKLGLIMALAHRPRLLALDEPTTALDPLTQDRLYQLLRRLSGDGVTIFFSSHVLSEVAELCDRVAIVRQGRMVADETLDALRAQASRHVTIRWPQAGAPSWPPDFLEILETAPDSWACALHGPTPALLAWLHDKQPVDLSIGPPDLDRVFRTYYRTREEAPC